MTKPPAQHDLSRTRLWMASGTRRLMAAVAQLADHELGAPSRLPGWSRAHVLGHVARNADALTRLAHWARTGVENPMYTNAQQRTDEIEQAAALPPDSLRQELTDTASTLERALDALDETSWQATVRSATGRTIPAAEIPWIRVREVWLHTLDLDTAITADELPPALVDVLLDDVTTTLARRDGCPALQLQPTDRPRPWHLDTPGVPTTVQGPATDLLAWLTGRITGTGLHSANALPALPRWL